MCDINDKLQRLRSILRDMNNIVIAYSGGVDSTLLATVAAQECGERVVSVLAVSRTYPSYEVEEAVETARSLGLNLMELHTDELENDEFTRNTSDRCFFCKRELFSRLWEIARSKGIQFIADGENLDDLADHRPGRRAAAELGVRSPLREAGFNKADIRDASRQMGLPTWDKPALACLASRIPYGTRIEPELLSRIDQAERFLRQLGLRQVRVRHHGPIARIEVDPNEISELCKPAVRQEVVRMFEMLGYTYTTIDLAGYRTGSMNDTLQAAVEGGQDGR